LAKKKPIACFHQGQFGAIRFWGAGHWPSKTHPAAFLFTPPHCLKLKRNKKPTQWSVLLSVVISIKVEIVFGMYPAMRAANLDPIVALQHE